MSEDDSLDEERAPRLEYFADRLNRVFAYYFCVLEFEDDENFLSDPAKNDRAWALQTIKNACLHESLLAVRDLDDFLKPRTDKSRDDDLKASDFGYFENHSFLGATERDSINKLIAHTTFVGAASQGSRWGVWELTSKCVSQCLWFLQWVETTQAAHFLLWTAAIACRAKTKKIFSYIAGGIAKRREET